MKLKMRSGKVTKWERNYTVDCGQTLMEVIQDIVHGHG